MLSPFILLLLCGFTIAQRKPDCPHSDVTLQEGIDLDGITGDWSQIFYSRGSFYDDVVCFHLHVKPVDQNNGTVTLTYHFLEKKNQDSLFELNLETSAVSNQTPHEGEIDRPNQKFHFLGNHIASDYLHYLIIYLCDKKTGKESVEIQMRREMKALKTNHREKINKLLVEKLGMKLRDMERVPARECPRDPPMDDDDEP